MEVAIIACALLGGAERGVGLADFHEALRGGGVVGVEVWVVGFGKFVELLFDFCGGGGWGEFEGVVVVWWACVFISLVGGRVEEVVRGGAEGWLTVGTLLP